MKIKITRTDRYAQEPWLPIVSVVEGTTVDLPEKLCRRIIELDGAFEVKDDHEKPSQNVSDSIENVNTQAQSQPQNVSDSIENVNTQAQSQPQNVERKNNKHQKRSPGQKRNY